MIKPRSLPSHFELQAEAQPWNFEGKTNSHSFDSFNQLNGNSMLPVTPIASVTTPATIDRGSKVGEITDPITSRGTTAYHEWSHTQCSFNTTQTFHQIHQRCTIRQVYPIQEVNGIQWIFCVCRICSGKCRTHSVQCFMYGPVKHGTMQNIPHLQCIPNFTLVTLKSHTSLANQ